MATLTVKNVGPIREAELEIKKHTVFIGPQGTGKSTLAKLIAICSNGHPTDTGEEILRGYNLYNYLNKESLVSYLTQTFETTLREHTFNSVATSIGKKLFEDTRDFVLFETKQLEQLRASIDDKLEMLRSGNIQSTTDMSEIREAVDKMRYISLRNTQIINKSSTDTFLINEVYVPAERILTAILSNSIWSLIKSGTNLPKSIIAFASSFEEARNTINSLIVPFLGITYNYEQGVNSVMYNDSSRFNLEQSASGYQSIIPLLLVIEFERRISYQRFIIEEPELNLYPTAQKDLIYSLIGGLEPDVKYEDAEWVITTHSPYVLSSFNTLMLAYKVAQRSEELRAEVEKIIPARCWINPDEFAAYYVDKGTVRSIISEKTGLIADNELDDVSEDLAGEQDQLFELSRSVSRA